jgi:orotate phosphoribosyltransferase
MERQLDARCLLAEPTSVCGRELRRGFVLHTSERVLIVDDVLATGLSLRETLNAIERFQPEIVGIEVIIDRSEGDAIAQFGVSCHALLTVLAQMYSSEELPMCKAGATIVKLGIWGI